jgi:ATP-binding cassette subfamily F protein 3
MLMPIASLTNLEKTFGQRVLFEHLDFEIDRGERVGLIGDNGSGKTTLFKMITGQEQPDSGTVAIAKSVKLGHLTQDPVFESGNTVMDEAELAFADLHRLAHELRDLEHEMAGKAGPALEKTLKRYQSLQHEFDLAGGYAWQHKLEATLLGVGLGRESWTQDVETLSGGQRSRLALAKLLVSAPDLLLLDEPTNHLDLAAIEWLENYLLDFDGAVLLISHDRFLLDRLATRIAWLTRRQLSSYRGNYSAFVQQRQVEELSQQRSFEQQQEYIAKQQEFVRRFGAGQRSKEAKGRGKRLNRLLASDAMVQAVESRRKIKLSLDTEKRAGDQVLSVRELSKSFEGMSQPLWKDVKFDVRRGDRVGIIGPNGSGKTTLLKVLLGQEDADAGFIKWGANLQIGYYDQRLDDFDPDNTVLEELRDERPDEKDQVLRDVLASMLFRGDDVHKPMGLLSGGERARVALAELLLDRPNVILLDEPTNHLDIASCEALENSLRDFAGTILCVSHDRYFLGKIVKRLLVLRPPQIVDFSGTYQEWHERQMQESARVVADQRGRAAAVPAKPQAASPDKKKDNPYLRPFGRHTKEQLEHEITETEIAIAECQSQFGDSDSFKEPSRAKRLQEKYETLARKLTALEEEYFARQ